MGRTLAIGDILGYAEPLQALLAHAVPGPEDTVIVLGDYVDVGPDVGGVLDTLLDLNRCTNLVWLVGNHEEMMLRARSGSPADLGNWLNLGGDRTLESYVTAENVPRLDLVPEAHWFFLESGVDYFETDSHLFVHGVVAPNLPMEEQPLVRLRWEKFLDPHPHNSGKRWICGHSVQVESRPINYDFAVCLNSSIASGGWMTCFDVEAESVLQVNITGCIRRYALSECGPEGDEYDLPDGELPPLPDDDEPWME